MPARHSLQVAGLDLTETQFAGDAVLDEHWHETPFICLVHRGTLAERARGQRWTREPGSLCFHPARESHADAWGPEGGGCFNVAFGGTWFERLEPYGRAINHVGEVPGIEAGRAAFRLRACATELASAPREAAVALEIEGLALLLIAEASRVGAHLDRGRVQPWMRRVEAAMRDGYRQRLDLDALAALVHVHPAHLARVFRRVHGCSLGTFQRRLRIVEAERLLRTTLRPISAIAHEVGFTDHSHFTRVFRRLCGRAPSEVRNARGRS